MSKILVLNDDTNVSNVVASTRVAPEGYSWYKLDDTSFTLMDSRGRLNISWMYQSAMQMAASKNEHITNKEPHKWLVNKINKLLRSNYYNLLGYDPVKTITTSNALTFQVPQYTAGPMVTYTTAGTYMIDRMIVLYGSWVSFDFTRYVTDIFVTYANYAMSPNGLILPTDEMHRENNAVNARHSGILSAASRVAANLKTDSDVQLTITNYVDMLREEYNIDITVVSYLEHMQHIGVFYKDCLNLDGEMLDYYVPKPEYLSGDMSLFSSIAIQPKLTVTYVTRLGHNALIQNIVDSFTMIKD